MFLVGSGLLSILFKYLVVLFLFVVVDNGKLKWGKGGSTKSTKDQDEQEGKEYTAPTVVADEESVDWGKEDGSDSSSSNGDSGG